MADNTTLYIIIGVVLLFALMNANAEPSATGAPVASAYLRRRVNLPEFIVTGVESGMPYEQVVQQQKQMYLRADPKKRLGVGLPQYVQNKPKLQGQLF
jgi:hypothetical protein